MKELSIEQKAKRYDEALEKSKRLYEQGTITESLCYVFPELRESEDERIRKWIIDDIRYNMNNEPLNNSEYKKNAEKAIAWLEAQGEHANFRNAIQIYDKVTRNEDGVLVNLSQLKRVAKPAEKQGEQKPYGQRKECKDCQMNYAGECKGSCQMKRDEQKPTDNVEPKFHEGEWIITKANNLYQVTAFIDDKYQLKYGDNYAIQNCVDVDRCARLWDVTKDAKNGDVLSDGTTIFIFKDLLSDGSVMSYCDYDTDSGESDAFCPLSVNLMCSKITPAAIEQRDTLMKAMADAGYTFDFEKKELKKVEPTNKYEGLTDFERTLADICIGWIGEELGWKQYIKDNADVLLKIAIKKFNSVQDVPFEQNPAWSEEDEELLSFCCAAIELSNYSDDEHRNYAISFLESLKDRVQPQPKYEWSDEDVKALNRISAILVDASEVKNWWKEYRLIERDEMIRLTDFLKSLRPQNTWKPSDEQINTLWDAIVYVEGCNSNFKGSGGVLEKLYNDLKKLREE